MPDVWVAQTAGRNWPGPGRLGLPVRRPGTASMRKPRSRRPGPRVKMRLSSSAVSVGAAATAGLRSRGSRSPGFGLVPGVPRTGYEPSIAWSTPAPPASELAQAPQARHRTRMRADSPVEASLIRVAELAHPEVAVANRVRVVLRFHENLGSMSPYILRKCFPGHFPAGAVQACRFTVTARWL